MNRRIFLCLLFTLYTLFVFARQEPKKLRFAFATDVHLNAKNDGNCFNGLKQALEKIKKSNVDFIMFGGDLCDISGMARNLTKHESDSMYNVFKQSVEDTKLPYYPTIGNHDLYYDNDKGYTEGDELFKTHFKESYYTFEKAGVRFFILNSVQSGKEGGYFVNEKQLEWLKTELSKVSVSTPIVISTHVPVYSIYYPVVEGKYVFADVIANYKELLKVFEKHNLKLVLQGHQHVYEEIYSQNVQYITAGAICANWWNGVYHGTEEGFLIVEVDKNNKFTWKYIDYGWTK